MLMAETFTADLQHTPTNLICRINLHQLLLITLLASWYETTQGLKTCFKML